MDTTTPNFDPGATTTTVIDADLPCSICGYNLKGLAPDANCPECGQPIARTYQFDLTKADPAWLRGQAATMPMLAALCMLNFAPNLSTWTAWLSYGMGLLLAGVNVWACYRLGKPDPADPVDRYGSVRRGVFLASIALSICVAIQMPHTDAVSSYPFSTWKIWVQIPLQGVNAFLALFLTAHLSRRAGNRSLHMHARIALWTFSLAQPGYLLFFLVDFRSIPEIAAYLYSIYTCVAQAALFLTLILLGRMYEVLRNAANRP